MKSKLIKIALPALRISLILGMAYYSFITGIVYEKQNRRSHPKWGTALCTEKLCKKELGPVFYEEVQWKIVAKALDELDKQKRKCVKMVN